jgi:2'-5' RNA ligase
MQKRLQQANIRMRWVKPAGLHLTLAFLGDIPAPRIETAGHAIDAACTEHPEAIPLAMQGLGAFPTVRRARVVWLGIGGAVDRLFALQGEIAEGLRRAGFDLERRRFRAHLTIGRSRGRIDPGVLASVIGNAADLPPEPFVADRVVLYQSTLHPAGARYNALVTQPLSDPHGEMPPGS